MCRSLESNCGSTGRDVSRECVGRIVDGVRYGEMMEGKVAWLKS